jgi:hypothetical protein
MKTITMPVPEETIMLIDETTNKNCLLKIKDVYRDSNTPYRKISFTAVVLAESELKPDQRTLPAFFDELYKKLDAIEKVLISEKSNPKVGIDFYETMSDMKRYLELKRPTRKYGRYENVKCIYATYKGSRFLVLDFRWDEKTEGGKWVYVCRALDNPFCELVLPEHWLESCD